MTRSTLIRFSFAKILGLSLLLLWPSLSCAQPGYGGVKPVITVNKYVVGISSSYELAVYPNGQATFYGLASRVQGLHILKLSSEQYRRALQVFDEMGFQNLESGPTTFMVAFATITLERDGVRKSVSFPSSGGTGREYAILINWLEEILELRDLICPRLGQKDGETVDFCTSEALFMNEQIKGTK